MRIVTVAQSVYALKRNKSILTGVWSTLHVHDVFKQKKLITARRPAPCTTLLIKNEYMR